MNKLKKILCLGFGLVFSFSWAQQNQFAKKRRLYHIKPQWHQLAIPDSMHQYLKKDYSDMRIYGILDNGDSTEVPFLLDKQRKSIHIDTLDFRLLNKATTHQGHTTTFAFGNQSIINQIHLEFAQKNFDWLVKLEASHDGKEWRTVLQNYRILAIHNEHTQYRFTNLIFGDSNYQYYRLHIPAKEPPMLQSAKVFLYHKKEGKENQFRLRKIKDSIDKKHKKQYVDLQLDLAVPVEEILLQFADTVDYYRKANLYYKEHKDSKHHNPYIWWQSATLSSLEENRFALPNKTTKAIRVELENQDNTALHFAGAKVYGPKIRLLARFGEANHFVLLYGNPQASPPHYDMVHYREKIPTNLPSIQLGKQQQILPKRPAQKNTTIFSKVWLWGVIILMFLLMGGYGIQMLRKDPKKL